MRQPLRTVSDPPTSTPSPISNETKAQLVFLIHTSWTAGPSDSEQHISPENSNVSNRQKTREPSGQMASNQDNENALENTQENTSEKDITRGITIMRGIIRDRDRGVTYNVEWNDNDQLIGSNAAKLTSYIGTLVRIHIPIITPRWKRGELDEAKEKVWTEIKRSFNIEDTRQRRDENFKKVSAINRERASKPAYPYKKGRLGYAHLEEKILEETKSDTTSLSAHLLWKEVRVGKDQVVNPDIQHVYDECETLSQSVSPGEDPHDTRSVLSRALNIAEYPGRKDKERYMAEKSSSHLKETSDKASINFQHKFPEGISSCQLYLSSPTYRLVGKGKVHNSSGDLLHNRPLPDGHMKVSVDIALDMGALLPVPDIVAETTLLRDAIGSFVAWPSDLIFIDDQTPTTPASKGKGILWHDESDVSPKEVPFQGSQQIFRHKELGVSIMHAYIRLLYDKLMRGNQLSNRFPFVSSSRVSGATIGREPNSVREHLVERFMATGSTESLYLWVYNTVPTGRHWLLVAIDPIKEVVYYLNSVDGDWTNYPDMKLMIDTAIQVFRCQREARVRRSKSNNINWIKVQCPQQQNGIDCGYFVMRFIKEIIQLNQIEIPVTV
ncbi:unnamed protein product [Vicia faba]|uniref:Ubiquitin-like protease family profile domain-containing protein n=1 Tax=Vicia faba TaxID=3906 RepID=A0AAV1AX66_VICFA|nr:unnamed protein product [Vicia faba]